MKLEHDDRITDEELAVINRAFAREPLEIDSVATFNRYAKPHGGTDKLVRFEAGLTFEVVKISRAKGSFQLYVIVRDKQQQLYISVNPRDAVNFFGLSGLELIESSMLWAIRQMHKVKNKEDYGADPNFGLF